MSDMTMAAQGAAQSAQDGAGPLQSGQQDMSNKPASPAPANMRETYSIMPSGEVVAIGMTRQGSGRSVQLEPWVWMNDERRWSPAEQVYGPDIAQELIEGMQRYERILQKDPKRAAEIRQRSDNTVDGTAAPDEKRVEKQKDVAKAAAAQAPEVGEEEDTPENLLTAGEVAR